MVIELEEWMLSALAVAICKMMRLLWRDPLASFAPVLCFFFGDASASDDLALIIQSCLKLCLETACTAATTACCRCGGIGFVSHRTMTGGRSCGGIGFVSHRTTVVVAVE